MALIPHDSFRQLDQWRKELDRFFQEFPLFRSGEFGPARIDIYETDTEVVASCELPGLESKDDIEIDVDENTLTLSGQIQKEMEVNEDRFHRRERFSGKFHRKVPLPAPVLAEEATARYKNGILEIRMPKAKQNKRRIDIHFHS